MAYIRKLPNVRYQSFLPDKNSSKDFIIVKNLFRKHKLLDDVTNATTLFNKFIVADGARPDNVAEDIYGDPELDYVVIISCGIVNLRDEWPLSNKDLYQYTENKYGLTEMNSIHHYETLEVKDENDRLILPAGNIVDSSFTIDGPAARIGGSGNKWNGSNPSSAGESKFTYTGEEIAPIVGVSNFEYETLKNEKKREIRPLKKQFLRMFITEHDRIMRYDRNSQYVTNRLITTENTDLIA